MFSMQITRLPSRRGGAFLVTRKRFPCTLRSISGEDSPLYDIPEHEPRDERVDVGTRFPGLLSEAFEPSDASAAASAAAAASALTFFACRALPPRVHHAGLLLH